MSSSLPWINGATIITDAVVVNLLYPRAIKAVDRVSMLMWTYDFISLDFRYPVGDYISITIDDCPVMLQQKK